MGMAIILLVVGLLVGGIIGYLMRSGDGKLQQKNDELKKELEEAGQNLTTYKQEVASHFLKTADLVNNMTDSYRTVHEHLAQGASTLCSEQLGVEQLDIRQTHLLDKAEDKPIEDIETKTAETDSVEATETSVAADETAEETTPESVIAKKESNTESDKQTVH